MMTISRAVILGIIQGITEFFPVSSSGHLVVAQSLLGLSEPQVAFDVFLHVGTLLAIVIFFRKDILNLFTKERGLFLYIIVASIPTFIIGYFFKDAVESWFGMPKVVGCMLVVTGAWLIIAALYSAYVKSGGRKKPGVLNSVIIGIAQGVSVMPGISRSGATIATGILTGLDREVSFKFSFLLALPAILGATALKACDIGQGLAGKDAVYFVAGGLTAMVVGLAAIKVLLNLVRKNRFGYFGIYCIILGLFIIISL